MTDKLNPEDLLDNAAACSQHDGLIPDTFGDSTKGYLRECVKLNCIDPLLAKVDELEKALKDRDALYVRAIDEIEELRQSRG